MINNSAVVDCVEMSWPHLV